MSLLYLVRHAIAADRGDEWPDDRLRPLTDEGAAKFKRAVDGLAGVGITIDEVVTSPFVRARQTADILAARLPGRVRVTPLDALAPGGQVQEILQSLGRFSKRASLALVGHDPGIGELAARLIGTRHPIAFRKGAVCCIEVDELPPHLPGELRWFLTPRLARALPRKK